MNLPNERESEREVLGALMVEPGLAATVGDIIRPDDFTSSTNRQIYEAISDLIRHGAEPDPVAVKAKLNGAAVDPLTLAEIASGVAIPSNAPHHARRIRAAAGLRSAATLGVTLSERSCDPDADLDAVLDMASAEVFRLATRGMSGEVPFDRLVSEAVDRIEYHFQTGSLVDGVPTGLRSLDVALGGLQPKWLVYVGARPGVGKTAMAIQAALHAAREGNKVLIVSLEMAGEELTRRMVCSVARVSYTKVRHKQLTPEDWQRFVGAQQQLADLPIHVVDTQVETVGQIAARARALRPDLIVVDYVQLMRDYDAPYRQEEVSAISRGLKLLARDTNIPILAAVQLNRNAESRADKAPILTDLRESGSLEQDADAVILLHREGEQARVEANLAKFRHGPTERFQLRWEPHITRFSD